ncbi:LysR family transcriptional regulator [Chelativorans alearense]|uniref:LysR family transcriptional regulator n=1 Tax=Chelativorans alearense TaxID=2681495 RepID=UPI0013D79B47|nr:LysR family transcriptional regulator [Chelativorans alearense]
MFQLVDLEAFLATARLGSFSAAAREMGTATSVVTKRVSRLEDVVGTKLFTRSTRKLALTLDGERLRPRLQVVLAELHETVLNGAIRDKSIRGRLRVKSPTTVGTMFVGQSLARFQKANPGVTTELSMMDRSVNPLEENFDVALGALPSSYNSVEDVPLCQYHRVVVASPDFIRRYGAPRRPAEIIGYNCLAFLPIGISWTFNSEGGTQVVDTRSVFLVNDSRVLLTAALEGLGITVLPRFLADAEIQAGRLCPILEDHPITPLWFKALVPRNRLERPEVAALVQHLRQEFVSLPPCGSHPTGEAAATQ